MHANDHPRPMPDEWRTHAACKGKTATFFPEGKGQPAINLVRKAKAICAACPVLVPCRIWAMTEVPLNEPGIRGGMTRDERRAAKRRMRAQRKATA